MGRKQTGTGPEKSGKVRPPPWLSDRFAALRIHPPANATGRGPAIRQGHPHGSLCRMTERHDTRHRRPIATLVPLRQLARQAAEAGEPLASIRRRLNIPKTTLNDWAKADGFRKCDLKARAAAAADAGRAAGDVRARAEEQLLAAGWEGPASGPERDIAFARARVGALLEAGMVGEAETDMKAARRLTALAGFAAPVAALLGMAAADMDDARNRRNLFVLMLKVCEAWREGAEAGVDDTALWHRYTAMFQHRVILYREVLQFFEPDYPLQAFAGDLAAALEGELFRDFRGHVRTLAGEARAEGDTAFADRLDRFLTDEARGHAEFEAFDRERGLRHIEM